MQRSIPTPAGRRGPGRRMFRLSPTPNAAPASRAGASAVVTTAQLAKWQPVFERYVGIGMAIAGIVGYVAALAGRWSGALTAALAGISLIVIVAAIHGPWRIATKATIALAGIVLATAVNDVFGWAPLWVVPAGIVLQSLTTFVQFLYCRNRRDWRYRTSVALDAGLNMRGYGMVMVPPLAAVFIGLLGSHPPFVLPGWAVPAALAAAWVVVAIFSVAVAVMMESILVRRV